MLPPSTSTSSDTGGVKIHQRIMITPGLFPTQDMVKVFSAVTAINDLFYHNTQKLIPGISVIETHLFVFSLEHCEYVIVTDTITDAQHAKLVGCTYKCQPETVKDGLFAYSYEFSLENLKI